MERNSVMETILRRSALLGAAAVLLFSIHFSYDGFDQSVTGRNANYSTIAMVMGYGLAIVFSIVQFIFNSGFGKLNLTLIVVGAVAYAYSIRMNYLGVVDILGVTDRWTAVTISSAMDILPESMIAWALGESLKGDLFGNAIKSVGYLIGAVFGVVPTDRRQNNLRSPAKPHDGFKRQNDQGHTQPNLNNKKGKGRQFHEQNRVMRPAPKPPVSLYSEKPPSDFMFRGFGASLDEPNDGDTGEFKVHNYGE